MIRHQERLLVVLSQYSLLEYFGNNKQYVKDDHLMDFLEIAMISHFNLKNQNFYHSILCLSHSNYMIILMIFILSYLINLQPKCHLLIIQISIHSIHLLISIQKDVKKIQIFLISQSVIWIHLSNNFMHIHQKSFHFFKFPKSRIVY